MNNHSVSGCELLDISLLLKIDSKNYPRNDEANERGGGEKVVAATKNNNISKNEWVWATLSWSCSSRRRRLAVARDGYGERRQTQQIT